MIELQLIPVAEVGLDSLTPRTPGNGPPPDALLFTAALQASLAASTDANSEPSSATRESAGETATAHRDQSSGHVPGIADLKAETSAAITSAMDEVVSTKVPEADAIMTSRVMVADQELSMSETGMPEENNRLQVEFVGKGTNPQNSSEIQSGRVYPTSLPEIDQPAVLAADRGSVEMLDAEPARQMVVNVSEEDALILQNLRAPIDLHVDLKPGPLDPKMLHVPSRPIPVWHSPESMAVLSQAKEIETIVRPASHIIPEIRTAEDYYQSTAKTAPERSGPFSSFPERSHSVHRASLATAESQWQIGPERLSRQSEPLGLKAPVKVPPGVRSRQADTTDSKPGDLLRIPYQSQNVSRMQTFEASSRPVNLSSMPDVQAPARFVIEEFTGNGPVQRIRIQLEPRDLGRVNIYLRQTRNGVHARVVAEQAHALPAIESKMEAMRAVLSARGIEFSSFSLTAVDAARSAGSRPSIRTAEKRSSRGPKGEAISSYSQHSDTSSRKARIQ